MVKITIIGWYGTETIGDRAILAGIYSLLSESYGAFQVQLGAIYPFFLERTLLEDSDFLAKCAGNSCLETEIFDSQNVGELNASIGWCDILVMGGGPLMGMPSLFMVEYAFAKAKKWQKKTMIVGCGVGPMIKSIYERSLVHIVEKSDLTLFRDETAKIQYSLLAGKRAKLSHSLIDPAVIAAKTYLDSNPVVCPQDEYIVACIRDFPMEYSISSAITAQEMNRRVLRVLVDICRQHGKKIKLLPMHYFCVGGDDRIYMNRLAREAGKDLFVVQNAPLTTEQTFHEFAASGCCIGMRFHSVVLQTILNGQNIILDYTAPNMGKIGGFLQQIDASEHYRDSYINLQTEQKTVDCTDRFQMDYERIDQLKKEYIQFIINT